jgi:hypothetical protein
MVTPINGSVLVELTDSLEYVQTPDRQFSTHTSGVIKAVDEDLKIIHHQSSDLINGLIGKTVYFQDFKDGTRVGDNMALIDFEDIKGYEDF